MYQRRKLWPLIISIILFSMLLAACATPTPEKIIETVIVTEIVEVEGEEVVKEVIITATPAPEEPAEEVVEEKPALPTLEEPDTLKFLYWQAITMLNPHLALGLKDQDGARIFYEPLGAFGSSGEMTPLLAVEVPSFENGGLAEDGLSVTWKLREGVTWHDGEPFDADDVIFTYEYLSNPDVGAVTGGNYELVDSVEKIDDYTVKVYFTDPNPAWFLPFTGVSGAIIPEHVFGPYNGANAREATENLEPVGTGPFKIVEFAPGDILVAEAYEDYWQEGLPHFQKVVIKGGGDATSGARAVLQTGEADYSYAPIFEPALMDEMESYGLGEVVTFPSPFAERILMNFTDPNQEGADGDRSSVEFPHPFLTDLRVRQAFAHALDRETIVDQLYGKVCILTDQAVQAPPQIVSTSEHPVLTYDLDEAARLLDEAGWVDTDGDGIRDKDGVKMSILYQTSINSIRQKTQEIYKQALESIGMEVELKSIDSSIFFGGDPANPDSLQHFYADIEEFNNGNSTIEQGPYMKFYTCDEITQKENNYAGRNNQRYCNPEYDALFQQSQLELDPDIRAELFKQMNDILVDDVVLIPICMKPQAAAVSYSIANYDLSPWDADLWNIGEWERIPLP
jgi:peptide/nickel transport system substrate-binding protein